MPDYESMSFDELRDAKVAIDGQIATLRAEKAIIAKVESEKLAEADAARIAANLTADQKRALLQVIAPEGIESAEGVNGQ